MLINQFFSSPLYDEYCIISVLVFITYMYYILDYKATTNKKSNRQNQNDIENRKDK